MTETNSDKEKVSAFWLEIKNMKYSEHILVFPF